MNRTALSLVLTLAFAAALQSSQAQAQLLRTFVSAATGNDANTCDRTVPCRTFAGALAKTFASGEIYVLDPGGYGIMTITQSVSIIGAGAASVRVNSGAIGITINAGVNDTINLRGLIIDGTGFSGTTGIKFDAGKSLTIEDCVIRHVSGAGIEFFPNATSNLLVSNTLVADGNIGILVLPSGAGNVSAVFNRVEVSNNANSGILLQGSTSTGTIKAIASDSVAARNGNIGFFAFTIPGQATTTLALFHSVSANNFIGIEAHGAGATLRAAQSTVTGNASGWNASSSGVIESYQDNDIDGNGANTGSLTVIGKQ